LARKHELAYALNAGGVDEDAIARVDLEKMRLAGEHPIRNWLPRVLGPMTLRPGTQSLQQITSDLSVRQVPFNQTLGGSYMLLLSPNAMRIVYNDAIVQVPVVATTIASGSWSDVSTAPATATGGATLSFNATSNASARLRQSVSVALADRAVSNILRIVVSRGPLWLRVGTTSSGEELIADTELHEGEHKIGFVPGAATVYIELRSDAPSFKSISQIQFESTLMGGVTGDLVVTTPWTSAVIIDRLRKWQSIDTMFMADGVVQQRMIQHRGVTSWSVVKHYASDGPWKFGTSRISLGVSALSGNVTVTASDPYFRSGHVGALLEITSTGGKEVTQTFTAAGQESDYITITGVGAERTFYITGTGTLFTGTIILQRSTEAGTPTVWSTHTTYINAAATFASTAFVDPDDNVTAHYRWRCSAYTSGSTIMKFDYASGVQVGKSRITQYTSSTSVNVEVLTNFGRTTASRDWRIGAWSDINGWPRTPIIQDDRLYWFRNDTVYGSVVDDYPNHDDDTVGDSGPLTRTIGAEYSSGVLWAASLSRLIVGTASFEATVQASEIDEPITPTRYSVRKPSRRGSADLEPASHDNGLFFVQRNARRIYEMFTPDGQARPATLDITRLIPTGANAGVIRLAVQQQPETRLYAVLADGTCLVFTFDRDDKVAAWTKIELSGATIEDVACLPNVQQDDVYFTTLRNGHRWLEKLSPEYEQSAVATCTLLDGHRVLTGSISAITGATQFASQTVQIWADGQRRADVTLDASGNALLGATYTRVVYGQSYDAVWKSVKLAYAAALGTALGQTKQIHGAAVILRSSCLDGVRFGGRPDALDPMPDIVDGAERTPNQLFSHYDHDLMPVQSDWTTDSRLYIEVDSAEGPCTVQAVVFDIETRDGTSQAGNG
jgi:hypothetical protein